MECSKWDLVICLACEKSDFVSHTCDPFLEFHKNYLKYPESLKNFMSRRDDLRLGFLHFELFAHKLIANIQELKTGLHELSFAAEMHFFFFASALCYFIMLAGYFPL